MRHFLTLQAITNQELDHLLDLAADIKAEPAHHATLLAGKSVALIFARPSTRTRVSFDVGIAQLGGHPLTLDMSSGLQTSRGESLADTGKTLARYVDAVAIRTPRLSDMQTLAKAADIPVINALSKHHHPCQALADMLTIREHLGTTRGKHLAYFGMGDNNVCHSLMLAAPRLGLHLTILCPDGLDPDPNILSEAVELAAAHSCRLEVRHEPTVSDADVVYTDTWVSMGDEAHADRLLRQLEPFRVTAEVMNQAGENTLFMHCLPAHRGQEVDAAVIDGPRSIVFDQAENRLHTEKALLAWLLADS